MALPLNLLPEATSSCIFMMRLALCNPRGILLLYYPNVMPCICTQIYKELFEHWGFLLFSFYS